MMECVKVLECEDVVEHEDFFEVRTGRTVRDLVVAVIAGHGDEWIVRLIGKTFDIKDQLKALGAKWNGLEKYWYLKVDSAEKARQACELADIVVVNSGRQVRELDLGNVVGIPEFRGSIREEVVLKLWKDKRGW